MSGASRASSRLSGSFPPARMCSAPLSSSVESVPSIGTKVFTFSHDTLVETPDIDFSQRWENEGDWELFGHIHASPTCPADAVAEILEALGLISDSEARMGHAAMNEFRRRVFAGQRGLGAWWALAERNAAAISAVLRQNPDLVKRSAAPMFKDFVAALGSQQKPIPDSFSTHVTALLDELASKGSRRLRIDAKAALGIVPEVKGKTIESAAETLNRRAPTRKLERLPRGPKRTS